MSHRHDAVESERAVALPPYAFAAGDSLSGEAPAVTRAQRRHVQLARFVAARRLVHHPSSPLFQTLIGWSRPEFIGVPVPLSAILETLSPSSWLLLHRVDAQRPLPPVPRLRRALGGDHVPYGRFIALLQRPSVVQAYAALVSALAAAHRTLAALQREHHLAHQRTPRDFQRESIDVDTLAPGLRTTFREYGLLADALGAYVSGGCWMMETEEDCEVLARALARHLTPLALARWFRDLETDALRADRRPVIAQVHPSAVMRDALALHLPTFASAFTERQLMALCLSPVTAVRAQAVLALPLVRDRLSRRAAR